MLHQVVFIKTRPLASPAYPVSVTPEVQELLDQDAVVAVGVSGGKDSQATAIRIAEYLDQVGHAGPRLLIHSDLGIVEWRESLPVCERLAKRIGWELVVVRRPAGDLMDRWEARWANSVERYASLSCVKLILPWSTPGMRFCTSELKTDIICRELTKRFPGRRILSVTGVRHDESAARAKMPVSQPQVKLSGRGASGLNWNPIITWPTPAVYTYLEEQREPLHEAYTRYGSTRVSCVYCIMGAIGDLRAAAMCEDNADVYRRMVDLEIASTFAFQGSRWLGDVAPHLLTQETRSALADAKVRGEARTRAEDKLLKHLLYTAGWPTSLPSLEEAELIADVRRNVATAVGLDIEYSTAQQVLERYRRLMEEHAAKQSRKTAKEPRDRLKWLPESPGIATECLV